MRKKVNDVIYVHRNKIDQMIQNLRKFKKRIAKGVISNEIQMPFLEAEDNRTIIIGVKLGRTDDTSEPSSKEGE